MQKINNSEVIIIETPKYIDNRGFFYESYNKHKFDKLINSQINFIQDNISFSKFGVLRGLHFQADPYEQSKLLRVIDGEILDVVVDLRKESDQFGQYISHRIDAQSSKQLFVPRGFAHGFIALSEIAIVSYKIDNIYDPKSERTLSWDDKDLNIDWKLPKSKIILSEKDSNGISFRDIKRML